MKNCWPSSCTPANTPTSFHDIQSEHLALHLTKSHLELIIFIIYNINFIYINYYLLFDKYNVILDQIIHACNSFFDPRQAVPAGDDIVDAIKKMEALELAKQTESTTEVTPVSCMLF